MATTPRMKTPRHASPADNGSSIAFDRRPLACPG